MDIGNGFGGDDRQRYLRIALIAGVALVVLLLILIVVAIVRNRAGGADPTVTPSRAVTRSPIVASPSASLRPTIPVSVPPSAGPSAAPSAPASPPTSARPSGSTGRAFVVANTGGDGVRMRSEPSTSAAEVVVLPDGTRLTEIGPGRNADGRDWLNVQDEAGNKGWVAAEFTSPAP